MATTAPTATQTATADMLNLTAPDPVPVVAADKAAGLVPIDEAKKSKLDEKVDAFYNSIFRNLVSHMVENPSSISSAAQLLFVARNLERIGDHATNVAEMVHYAATGVYAPDADS